MGIALAAIGLGAWLAYSALKGVSLADAFTGKGDTLDPAAKITADTQSAQSPTDSAVPGGSADLGGMETEQNRMNSLHQPYKWGGGHGSFDSDGPWDCSGAVSWLLHSMGLLSGTPKTSTGFMTWGKGGRGKAFTVYANPSHVFIHMESGHYAGQDWGTTNSTPGGGPGWHHHPTAGFIARHAEGH